MEPLIFETITKDYSDYKTGNNQNKKNAENALTKPNTDNKKLKLALAGLAVAGTAIAAGILIYNGRVSKLKDITFEKGKALKSNGSGFSGIIKDKLPNGDSIKLRYKNGILLNSQRTGSVNISKSFNIENGNKIITTTTPEGTRIVNVSELIHNGKIKHEANVRIKAQKAFEENAKKAQALYNKPFEEGLSNKSASESAKVFEEIHQKEIINETNARIEAQKAFEENAKKAQAHYNKPFEEGLSNKSASESAKVFEEIHQKEIINEANARIEAQKAFEENAKKAQAQYNKPFEDALSHKSAKESATPLSTIETKKSITTSNFDENGNVVKRITRTKNGNNSIKTTEYLDTNGNVKTRITLTPDHAEYRTTYNNGTKIVEKDYEYNKNYGRKVYTMRDGKLKSAGREIHDYKSGFHKTVEYLDDGISKTTYEDPVKGSKIIYRDKKGKIIDIKDIINKSGSDGGSSKIAKPLAELDSWYIHYVELCEKYGEAVRPCGVSGGAGSHYFELLKREQGLESWKEYLRLERYRSQYDKKSKTMETLREMPKEEVKSYFDRLKNGVEQAATELEVNNPYTETNVAPLVLA